MSSADGVLGVIVEVGSVGNVAEDEGVTVAGAADSGGFGLLLLIIFYRPFSLRRNSTLTFQA